MKLTDNILALDKTPWRLFEPENNDRDWRVLWLQGFTSTIEGHTEGVVRLAEATSTTFAMLEYAGHGNNPIQLDDASRKQQFNEVTGVYDELKKLGYTKIIVIGGSFGSYMASLLVSVREAQALVLRAPANYPEEEFELAYRDTAAARKDKDHYLYRQSIDENYSNNAIEEVRGFAGPTFVLEHEKDEVINASIPKSYYNAAQQGNYLVIPGVKHSPKQMPNPQEYFELIELWVTTIIVAIKRVDKLSD